MNSRYIAASIGIAAFALVGAGQSPASAFNFTTNYNTEFTEDARWKNNLWLESVEFTDEATGESKVIKDFTLVESVENVTNDLWTGGNSGAASVDLGDYATLDLGNGNIVNHGFEAPDNTQLSAVLSNKNLSNIIDTEDKGNFAMDLYFEKAVDNLFVWERGMNSKMDLQAIDQDGNALGEVVALESSKEWNFAGYKLNTQEIGNTQKVGSLGVSMADLGVDAPLAGVRVFSRGRSYRGPDWKILGSVAAKPPRDPERVPEPSALLGLMAVGVIAAKRLKKA